MKPNLLALSSALLLTGFSLLSSANACTNITLAAKDGTIMIGRTLRIWPLA